MLQYTDPENLGNKETTGGGRHPVLPRGAKQKRFHECSEGTWGCEHHKSGWK